MGERLVDEIMSRPVVTVTPTTSLRDVAAEMIRRDVGAVAVVDGTDQFEGLLTATGFVLRVRDGNAKPAMPVSEAMEVDVVTTQRRVPVSDVVDAMLDHRIHHVPVVDGTAVVGMVTTFDLVATLSGTLEP